MARDGRRIKWLFFFPDLLDEFSDSAFLLAVSKKFHYEKEQAQALGEVAEEMLPFLRREAFWERREFDILSGNRTKESGMAPRYEKVVMSLGSGIDRLQEAYHKKGLLSESYMLEALAGELLLKGYNAYNRYIKENSGLHVAGYYFPGSGEKFPLEMLGGMLKDFHCQITCNSAFCMSPQKSVLFVAELTMDEKIRCGSICTGCRNRHCPNRMEDEFYRYCLACASSK